MKGLKTYAVVFCGLAIAINIILGIATSALKLPFYLDTLGTVSDVIVMALKKAGSSIFAASFLAKIGNNLLDKVGTCLIAYLLLKNLPASMKNTIKSYNRKELEYAE